MTDLCFIHYAPSSFPHIPIYIVFPFSKSLILIPPVREENTGLRAQESGLYLCSICICWQTRVVKEMKLMQVEQTHFQIRSFSNKRIVRFSFPLIPPLTYPALKF